MGPTVHPTWRTHGEDCTGGTTRLLVRRRTYSPRISSWTLNQPSRWWLIALSFLWLLPATPIRAAELPGNWRREVAEYLTAAVADSGALGAAVVIVDASGVIFTEGLGVAAHGGPRVTPGTPFHIASLSKAITGLAVMQLVEAGRLDLDTPLGATSLDLGWQDLPAAELTVSDLLSHTSGWSEIDGLVNRVGFDSGPDALEVNAQRIAATPLSHPTGEFEYSNANYDVLGYLVQRASGVGFADYLRANVFDPLAMTSSFATESEALAAGIAEGHYPFFGLTRRHQLTFVAGSVPSSFMSSSASDLGNFLIAYLNAGKFEGSEVLSATGMATVQRPITNPSGAWDGYAMGWWVFPLWSAGRLTEASSGDPAYEVPVVLEHQGDHESYASSMLLIPEHELGVVVLLNINDESAPSRYHQIHLGIADILLGASPQAFVAEDMIRRNAKLLALIVVGFFILRALFAGRSLSRLVEPPTRSAVVRKVVPFVVDVVLVGGLWWFLVTEAGAPLILVRRSTPDIFLAAVVATCFGIAGAWLRWMRVRRL
jgi:CubicO group peptidase (beta-lactamase class C family)